MNYDLTTGVPRGFEGLVRIGRPTDRPSTDPLDLETLSRSTDWLTDRLRVMPA